jgi:hypothetical protein
MSDSKVIRSDSEFFSEINHANTPAKLLPIIKLPSALRIEESVLERSTSQSATPDQLVSLVNEVS